MTTPIDLQVRNSVSATELLSIAIATFVALIFSFSLSFNTNSPELQVAQNVLDPLIFRAAGSLLGDGLSPYSPANLSQHISDTLLEGKQTPYVLPFAYPPNSLPLFRLRALGDYELNTALTVSFTLLFAMTILALLTNTHINSPPVRILIVFFFAAWTPSLVNVALGQTGHLAAALGFLILWAWEKRRTIVVGIALGFLAFKPQYAIPLGLIALTRKDWSILAIAAITFGLCCVYSASLYGWDMWPAFWQSASSLNSTMRSMESWLGVAALTMPQHLDRWHQLAVPVYLCSMTLMGATLYVWRERMSLIAAAALAITFTLIVSPNTHPYDMGLFFIPILYVTNRLGSKLWVIILVVIIFLLPNIYVSLSIVRFFFLLACLGYILRLITTDRRFVERTCK